MTSDPDASMSGTSRRADLRHRAPIRITTVIGTLSGGGAERNLLRLCDALAVRGHHVTLVTVNPGADDFYDVPPTVERRRAHPSAFMDCRWYNLACQRVRRATLRRALLESRPDVIISFIDTMNVGTLVTLWRDKTPVIVSERTDPRFKALQHRWSILRRLVYPFAARVIVQTESVAAWARRNWPRWRVEVIPNPVFGGCMASGGKEAKDGRMTIVSMGRLVPLKQFDQLIRAFASISQEFPDWDLLIIGDGPERPRLGALASGLDVSGRVLMPGALKSPGELLASSDLFAFSSRHEGFPNALCEAMASGLPVVCYDCPSGPREIVRHEIDGLLVPPQDVDALSRAMRRLIDSPSERQRMAERAREITTRFAPEGIFDHWERLIQDVLSEAA